MSFAKRSFACLLAFLAACTLSPLPARADDDAEMKQEIADLKSRLQDLESRLAKQEAAKPSAPAAAASYSGGASDIPSWVRKVELSGFADVSYTYNANEPKSRVNSLRVFDNASNSFQPNAFELVVQKPVSSESPVGFRADVDLGDDSEVTGLVSTGLGSTTDEIDLQQMYAEALLPVGGGLNLKAGKFVTLAGAEVIESKDNWNFSRSLLFGFAIPFTHTGVRLSYPVSSCLTAVLGVNNGWDVVNDNNGGKTVEWQLAATPCEKSFVALTGIHGPEQGNDNHDYRHVFDLVAGYNPCDKLSLKLNFDYGMEEDLISEANKNASWMGLAGYARYQFIDWYALALRSEYFADNDGMRTAVRTTNGVNDLRVWELTLTNEFKIYKDLITRLEYRHDQASDKVFADGGGVDNTQDTVSAEVIYAF